MPQQPEIQDIYPLSFMQEGMLFTHCMMNSRELILNRLLLRSMDSLTWSVFRKVWMLFLTGTISFEQHSSIKM